MVELSGKGRPRTTTGRVKLVLVEGENAATMKEAFAKHIAPGAEIWSDGHKAFEWLNNDPRW